MTDRKPTGTTSVVDTAVEQAKAALTKLRGYAADHSSDINAAIDKAGDFVNKQTGQKYRSQIGNVQSFARTQVNKFGQPAGGPDLTDARRAFGLDEDAAAHPGATAWRQPPSSTQPAAAPTSKLADDIKGVVAKAKTFASDHVDDAHRAVDKVAGFVDDKTQGKYADKIAKVRSTAKGQVEKLRETPSDDELLDPLADDEVVDWKAAGSEPGASDRPAFDPLKPAGQSGAFGLDDEVRDQRDGI